MPVDDDLDDELANPPEVALAPVLPADRFAEAIGTLTPNLETMLAGFAAGRIRMTDPQQRADLVRLRAELDGAIAPLTMARRTIDRVFLMYAVEAGAKEVPIPGMAAVHYEPARGEYVVDGPALRAKLLELSVLDGAPTRAEVDEALAETTVVTVKANNTKLNALVKRYGGGVADACARFRQFVMPEPERGRVRFPEVKR